MNSRLAPWVFVSAFSLATLGGCRHCCNKQPASPCAPPGVGAHVGALPPGNFNPLPPEGSFPAPSPPPSGAQRNYEPPRASVGEGPWRPAPPSSAANPDGSIRLLPPGSDKPQVPEERSSATLLPVGIPQFAIARDRVASGLKPFPDGLDWLKANGYRAVLHIRRPGEDDAAARKQVEKSGLIYLSMDVAPETLSRTILDDFNRLVENSAYLPLFVYDRDGMLAGGLWYLHFRTVDLANEEEARIRAARLGLKGPAEETHKEMWLAIQKVLGNN